MTKSQPILSICIPTYNRPKELMETLRILCEQLDELPVGDQEQIEIIVSDNNSSVTTITQIFDMWAKDRPVMSFHMQASNVGATQNFEYCYRTSIGRFVFILSDDDHLTHGSLSRILESLKNDDPDILFLPFFIPTVPGQGNISLRMKLKRNAFLRQTGLLPTLISACILKKNRIGACLGRYLDTNMHHFYYFLFVLESGECFVYLNHQMIFSPYAGNSGGYSWFNVFAGDFFRIINEFQSKRIDKKILHRIKQEMFVKRIIPTYVNHKINGYTISKKFTETSNFDIIRLISKYNSCLPAYWLIFLPIVLSPKIVLKLFKKIYLDIRKFYINTRPTNV